MKKTMGKRGTIGTVLGTVAGRVFDLFLYVSKANPIAWAADEEQIHPIEETRRKNPTDMALVEAGETPGSYMGALRQGQYSKTLGKHLKTLTDEGKLGINVFTEKDIENVMYSMEYGVPDDPGALGPNFVKWVEKNKEMLAKNKDWDGILTAHGLEPTIIQYGLGAPVQKRTFEEYRAKSWTSATRRGF